MLLGIFAAVLDVRVRDCGRSGRNVVEEAMVSDQGGDWQVDILADKDVFLYVHVWGRRPVQLGEVPSAIFSQHGVMVKQTGARGPAFGSLEKHIGLWNVLESRAVGDQFGVMAADGREHLPQAILEIGERTTHGGRLAGDEEMRADVEMKDG